MTKITLIVPVFNKAPYLRSCLDSIALQTHTDFEAIIVDDGSTDNSREIIETYLAEKNDDRFQLVTQENRGASAARNRGLSLATGDYIATLDGDDLLSHLALELLVELVEETGCEHIRASMMTVPDKFSLSRLPAGAKEELEEITEATRHEIELTSGGELYARLFGAIDTTLMTVGASLYSRATIEAYGLRFNEDLSNTEDLLFNAEYFAHNPTVALIQSPLYFYRQTPTSLSRTYNPKLHESSDIVLEGLESLSNQEETRAVAEASHTAMLSYMSWYYTLTMLNEAGVTDPSAPLYSERIAAILASGKALSVDSKLKTQGSVPLPSRLVHSLAANKHYGLLKVTSRMMNASRARRRARRIKTFSAGEPTQEMPKRPQ